MKLTSIKNHIITLALSSTMFSSSPAVEFKKSTNFHQPRLISESELSSEFSKVLPRVKEFKFTQSLTHQKNSATFSQRYWVFDEHAVGNNAPVLLHLCGEWECGPDAAATLADRAQKLGAIVVALEHRYYGQSTPTTKQTLKDLKYLRTDLALQDIRGLQTHLIEKRGWTNNWIVLGVSYAGTLATYFRIFYPERVVGAVASSAPLTVDDDFYAYETFAKKALGGACAAGVRKVTDAIYEKIQTPAGFLEMKTVFGMQELKDVSQEDFLAIFPETIPAFSQSGEEQLLCNVVTSEESIDSQIKSLAEAMKTTNGGMAYAATPLDRTDVRWFYQQCTSMGWFHTIDSNKERSLFSFSLGLDYYRSACRRVFGPEIDAERSSIKALALAELTRLPSANILFTQGAADPWSAASYPESSLKIPGVVTLVMEGGAHGSDFAPFVKDTKIPVAKGQILALEKMASWNSGKL
jgi:pimeloyl-ACP methyl ester carboxylesterase